MEYLLHVLTGICLSNALPHLCAGLLGMPFPTAFSRPFAVGDSNPFINFCWGLANLLGGLALLYAAPVSVGPNLPFAALMAGFITTGALLSAHFGAVRADRD